jgi:two-component system sensor histidine kinase/response regulator
MDFTTSGTPERPTDELEAEQHPVLSMLPAGPADRRFAVGAALSSLAIFTLALPFAREPLPRMTAFIPCYESALVVNDLITTILLYGQFSIMRSRALLVLASTYCFSTLITVVHALSFPGLFSETGLLGAGTQSTAWLYMFWHGGFPAGILWFASLKDGGAGRTRMSAPSAVGLAVAAVLALVAALTVLATVGAGALPEIMQGDGYSRAMLFVIATVWSLSLLALFALSGRRPKSILDLWLMVVLCAWLCDVALSAMFNAGRFDLGFYVGRVYGLTAASTVLAVLLLETVTLYVRLARAMEAERQERERRLREMRSELIHVSRLSELGQMVSALAHEVNQPLTAIGNYIRASERLGQIGDPAGAQTMLGKAADEVNRAGAIIRRLRDFIKKNKSRQREEDLRATIEETMALALIGTDRGEIGTELHVHPAVPAAHIDKIQIQQVLLNLIRNALEAMADRPSRALVIATAPSARAMVEISVADTGPGLADEVRARLFQPFVTTKSTGMGVGLSICHAIIEAHGGRLWAEDNPSGGTVFRFTVPQLQAGG